jgi:DNA polymerase elongation subunit (family B)
MGKTDVDFICIHNGKQFDIPFISKRIMYHGLSLPAVFEIADKKPWDLNYIIDTKEHLKFGGMDAPSLELLCYQLGIKTAAENFEAEPTEIAKWYAAGEFDKIKDYCEYDVKALFKCFLKLVRSKEYPTGINDSTIKL